MKDWCDRHNEKIQASGVQTFAIGFIVKRVIETGRHHTLAADGCWACALTESEVDDALREGAVLDAKTDALGGSYTTDKIAVTKKG